MNGNDKKEKRLSLPKRFWREIKEHPVRNLIFLVGIYFALKLGKQVYAGRERVLIKDVEHLILTCAQLGQKFSLDAWQEVQAFAQKAWGLPTPPESPGELVAEMVKKIRVRKSEFQKRLEEQDRKNYERLHNLALKVHNSRKKNPDGSLEYCQLSFVANNEEV